MAFPNVSDLVATTIESRTRQLADNVSNSNALLARMKSTGGIRTFSGGTVIFEELAFNQTSNGAWYSGYDNLSTAASDNISAAQFNIKQLACPVSISGLEEIQNSGREAFIDLLDGRMGVAEDTMTNLLSQGLYSTGSGFGGKQLDGLGAAVTTTPTVGVYGGINRAAWPFWQNKKQKGGGVDYAGALTSATILGIYNKIWATLVRGTDKPNLIATDPTHWAVYQGALQPNQRFTDPKMAAQGFDNVLFMSAPVVLDTTISGISGATSYFLNTKFLRLRPHSSRNMVALDPSKRYSVNQDASVQIMAWAGNLTSSGIQFQGIVQD